MGRPSRSDVRLYSRAFRQGWDIPAKKRKEIITMLVDITQAEKASHREKTSAARALMQASRVELDAIRLAQMALFEDMSRRLEALEGEGGSHAKLARPAGEA
jgi:hypothetical protein